MYLHSSDLSFIAVMVHGSRIPGTYSTRRAGGTLQHSAANIHVSAICVDLTSQIFHADLNFTTRNHYVESRGRPGDATIHAHIHACVYLSNIVFYVVTYWMAVLVEGKQVSSQDLVLAALDKLPHCHCYRESSWISRLLISLLPGSVLKEHSCPA